MRWQSAIRLALVLAASGCAQTPPRFSADVQTAVVAGDMQRLETEDMRLYYPARDRAEALRAAARFEACLDTIRGRARIKTPSPDDKANIVLPPLPFNNAYVQGGTLGLPPIAVVPTYDTSDVFAIFGIPPDAATIGCHEMVHYVHVRQLSGLPSQMEWLFGYGVPPELGLDPWFWEGIAVYYETKLQGGIGRLGNAFWSGTFAAGVAESGLGQGDVDYATRRIPFGGHYLVGSHFVDWLVRTYGEDKLWDVIERQSDEVFFPFGVGGRFKNAYKKSLGVLYTEFVAAAKKAHPPRARPAGQTRLRVLDQTARLAVAHDGTWATVDQGLDTPPRLVAGSPEGEILIDRNLTDVLPGRDLVAPSALGTSGMSFTKDGRELWFVALDRGRTFATSRLVKVDVRTGDFTIVTESLGGAGGSIAPDGSAYWFSYPSGDTWELAVYDVSRKVVRRVATYGPRIFVVEPRISPDGSRIAATFMTPSGPEIRILDSEGVVQSRLPSPPGPTIAPSWIDDDTLVFLAENAGTLQVHRAFLAARSFTRATDAPYLAFAPGATKDKLLFLNRDGWGWTLDTIAFADTPAFAPRPFEPPSHALATSTPPSDAAFTILRDEPYRATDTLFVPTLRGPSISTNGVSTGFGLGLSGGDRLGWHRWSMEGSWDFVVERPNGSATYINGALAPVFVRAAAERDDHAEDFEFAHAIGRDSAARGERRESTGSLLATRTFWSSNVASGLRFDETDESVLGAFRPKRAAGAFTSLSYVGAEATSAAGVRRALAASISGTIFPAIGARERSDRESGIAGPAFGDARAAIQIVTPLPLSRRHTLSLSATGRILPGLKSGDEILEIGGSIRHAALSSDVLAPKGFATGDLPTSLRFQEPLRGFENLSLVSRRVATAEALYRMPLVADWGTIQTTTLFPSFLFRQIDLEAFGTGASLLDGRELALAAGGAIVGRFKIWLLPIDLGLQIARRLTYDEGVSVSFVGTGSE